MIDELSDFCQRAMMELVTAGVTIAKAVADRAETASQRERSDPYASTGFKGGVPAAKAYAVAGQGVRRSVLLLQKVIHYGWWMDYATPGASARAERWQKAALGLGEMPDGDPPARPAPRGEGAERLDRLERLEMPEDAAAEGAVTPDRAVATVAALRRDMEDAARLADTIWPRPGDDAGGDDEDAPGGAWRDPPD